MDNFEEQLLRDAEDDARCVEYIKQSLPQDIKDKFQDDDLYYFIDVLSEYISDLIDQAGDTEEMEIDIEAAASYLVEQARKDNIGKFDPDDVRWVVDAELDYGEQAGAE